MWANPQFPVDLVIFTEEILNVKLLNVELFYFLKYENRSKYSVKRTCLLNL